MTMQKGICQECQKEYDYEYNPKFPRKYCPECSAKKKAEFEGRPVTDSEPLNVPVVKIADKPVETEIKKPTGEYQSLVYNKTLSANSYEVGSAGNRFKLYFETVEELQAKLKELKDAKLMFDEVKAFE